MIFIGEKYNYLNLLIKSSQFSKKFEWMLFVDEQIFDSSSISVKSENFQVIKIKKFARYLSEKVFRFFDWNILSDIEKYSEYILKNKEKLIK